MTTEFEYSRGASFPVLDADRDHAHLQRQVIADAGCIEPFIPEADGWCTMPLRVVVDSAAGVHLELGPYDLDGDDVQALQNAIQAYCRANGRGPGLHLIEGGRNE